MIVRTDIRKLEATRAEPERQGLIPFDPFRDAKRTLGFIGEHKLQVVTLPTLVGMSGEVVGQMWIPSWVPQLMNNEFLSELAADGYVDEAMELAKKHL